MDKPWKSITTENFALYTKVARWENSQFAIDAIYFRACRENASAHGVIWNFRDYRIFERKRSKIKNLNFLDEVSGGFYVAKNDLLS